MKLDAVAVALPSRIVTNDEILQLVCRHSQHRFTGNLKQALRRIRHTLHCSDAKTRRWLAPDERPLDLISRAMNTALKAAAWDRATIDLLIYAGVDRGFLEPANAYLVAQALELPDSECFDVLDACNGWARAVRLAHALFKSGDYRNIAIVNSEFNMFEGGTIYPFLFQLEHPDEIHWCLPAYTLGEAATVTLLSSSDEDDWEFHFSSRNDLADLCTVPVYSHERYCRPSDRIARKGRGLFSSFGSELFAEATVEAIKLFEQLSTPRDSIRAIFPHAATKAKWDEIAQGLGVADRLFHIYPQCGNLVSASVPAGIAMAIEEGRVARGDRLVTWVASAGMAFSVCSFVY